MSFYSIDILLMVMEASTFAWHHSPYTNLNTALLYVTLDYLKSFIKSVITYLVMIPILVNCMVKLIFLFIFWAGKVIKHAQYHWCKCSFFRESSKINFIENINICRHYRSFSHTEWKFREFRESDRFKITEAWVGVNLKILSVNCVCPCV